MTFSQDSDNDAAPEQALPVEPIADGAAEQLEQLEHRQLEQLRKLPQYAESSTEELLDLLRKSTFK